MNRDRQTILSLIAAGRINAAEAERLLVATSDAHELMWIVAVCALAVIAPLHWSGAAPAHAVQNAISAAAHTLHHAFTLALQLIGGRL